MKAAATKSSAPQNLIEVTKYTHGLIGPDVGFFGTTKDGGRIKAVTPPGCWGPMITPGFQGGHEVTQPVYVEGAEVGDAIALFIERVDVLSLAATSGVMSLDKLAFGHDPFVDKKCPQCGTSWPESRVEGTGQESVRCANCGAEASPFHFEEGYTVAFDKASGVSLAVDEENAHKYALDAKRCAALPKGSEQNSILLYEPHTLAGLPVHVRPSIGNIGTIPSMTIPDSHNAGDFGASLVDAPHRYKLTKEELQRCKTDGHLDCKDVRPGAVLLCPVKVKGGGIYMGDAHSIIGTGELALHAIDVTAAVTVKVKLVKNLNLDGPILFPNVEDLPEIAKPFTAEERRRSNGWARSWASGRTSVCTPFNSSGPGRTSTSPATMRSRERRSFSESQRRNCSIEARSTAASRSRDCPGSSSSRSWSHSRCWSASSVLFYLSISIIFISISISLYSLPV